MTLDWAPDGIDVALAKAGWAKRINAPITTSAGRLFDAAAALIQLKQHTTHEGEAAMAVEALAGTTVGQPCPVRLPLHRREDGVLQADWAPLVARLLGRGAVASMPRRRLPGQHGGHAGGSGDRRPQPPW